MAKIAINLAARVIEQRDTLEALNMDLITALEQAVCLRTNLCESRDQQNDPHLESWTALLERAKS